MTQAKIKLNKEERDCIIIKYYHWVQYLNPKRKHNTPSLDFDNHLIDETLKFINKNKLK